MEYAKLKSLFISPDTTIKVAIKKLNETSEKILFVVGETNVLQGTVTDGDIRRQIIDGLDFNKRVEGIMRKEFISFDRNMPAQDIESRAKKIMVDNKIEHIPILGKNGEIFDTVSWTDIMQEKRNLGQSQLLSNPVVVMAGGKGMRLDPLTRIIPKPLIPINDKSIIEFIMEEFYRYGFHKFIYTLNYKKEYIKLFLRENNLPYEISWIEEDDFLGTAGSLHLLKDKVGETFFVSNCDILLLNVNFKNILEWHKEHKAGITIVGSHEEVEVQYGVLQFSNGNLERIIEKPTHDVLINSGVYVIEPHIISYIKPGQRLDMNQLVDLAIKKERVSVYPIYSGWLDVGRWEEYKKSIEKLNVPERFITEK